MSRAHGMLLLLAVGLAADLPALAVGRDSPRLALTSGNPLTVSGRGFRASEVVRVRVRLDGRSAAKRVTASSRGQFRSAFAGVEYDRCGAGALSITATGNDGSVAKIRRPPRECPPSEPGDPSHSSPAAPGTAPATCGPDRPDAAKDPPPECPVGG